MSEPKKIQGETLKRFPGGTWNALVEGEFRDRVPKSRPQQASPFAPASTVFIQLIWMGDTDLPPGSVVSLTEPPKGFDDDRSVPFGSLVFKCDVPETATLEDAFAITSTPINVVAGKRSMGWGYIPGACWAQVTVNDSGDDTAELVDGETLLSSTTAGRVPIIWKPSGTGVKWCVVQLAASSGGEFIITGLATAAVTSGDATFTIDGLANVTAGTLPSEPLTVNNTLTLTLGDNQKVYAILNVDGEWDTWADTGEGTTTDPSAFIFADFTATATSDRATDTITADIDDYWGATPAATTSVTVHKLSDHDVTIYSGDKFRGIWDTTAEEWKLFWFDGLRITIQGTVSNSGSDVTPATSTFSLTSPALVNGWRLPASTITVTNDPPLYVAEGTTIKARFNLTIGTDPLTNWDTGDAGNFLYLLKGIGGYNAGGTKQYVINDSGSDDPEWGDGASGTAGLIKATDDVPARSGTTPGSAPDTDYDVVLGTVSGDIKNYSTVVIANGSYMIVVDIAGTWVIVSAFC